MGVSEALRAMDAEMAEVERELALAKEAKKAGDWQGCIEALAEAAGACLRARKEAGKLEEFENQDPMVCMGDSR